MKKLLLTSLLAGAVATSAFAVTPAKVYVLDALVSVAKTNIPAVFWLQASRSDTLATALQGVVGPKATVTALHDQGKFVAAKVMVAGSVPVFCVANPGEQAQSKMYTPVCGSHSLASTVALLNAVKGRQV